MEQILQDRQMSGAGDRQKLCDALHQTEQDRGPTVLTGINGASPCPLPTGADSSAPRLLSLSTPPQPARTPTAKATLSSAPPIHPPRDLIARVSRRAAGGVPHNPNPNPYV